MHRTHPQLSLGIALLCALHGACLRTTVYCEGDEDCPAGWRCGAEDRCVEHARDLAPLDDLLAPAEDLPALRPASCAEVLAAQPGAPDGDYTLYLGEARRLPLRVFCRMATEPPREYLTLPHGDGNYSQFTARLDTRTESDVRTTYWRLRLDPASLRVDPDDRTYATSTGRNSYSEQVITAMPYGAAMDCRGPGSSAGVGSLDLSGTPLSVAPDQFRRAGSSPGGTITYSQDQKVVRLTGGGNCGWVSPPWEGPPLPGNVPPLQLRYP